MWGFVSLDYLYLAYGLSTGTRSGMIQYSAQKQMLCSAGGIVLFVLWFFIMAVYYLFIRSLSPRMDFIVRDKKTGEDRVRRKWFDVILQLAIILTGVFARWIYLCIFYFPNR